MNKTKIEWADSTWNPVTGCYHGCGYCYARKMAQRFSGIKIGDFNGQICVLKEPYRTANGKINSYPYEFMPTFHKYRLKNLKKWIKPRNIFVCSMADMFGGWIPDDWIEEVFDACIKAPQHTYLFLTKNPKRYGQLMNGAGLPRLPNFWYGSTATYPGMPVFYNERYNTFVSFEPLLEPFDNDHGKSGCVPQVNWAIIGAETGNRKGKVVPQKEWIDNMVEQCDAMHIPVFMKDSLIPIMGEGNMRREFPWESHK